MADAQRTVDGYFGVWNTTKASERRELIAQTWSNDAHYVDPLLEGAGRDGVDAMIAAVQAQFPGHRLRQAGPLDSHHDRVRFAWEMVGPDGETPVLSGIDFGVIDASGRIQSITGFLESVPAELLTR